MKEVMKNMDVEKAKDGNHQFSRRFNTIHKLTSNENYTSRLELKSKDLQDLFQL